MKPHFLLLATALLALVACSRSTQVPASLDGETLQSPDGKLALTFALGEDGVPMYQLQYDGCDVILPSKLGYSLRGRQIKETRRDKGERVYADPVDLQSGFSVVEVRRDSLDEVWEPVWGEESHIRNHYKELAVTLAQGGEEDGRLLLTLRFRLYDDGLGFRYEFPRQKNLTYFTVKEERTEFRLTGDHTAFWIPGDYDTQEYSYTCSRLSEVPALLDAAADFNASQTLFSDTGVQTALQLKTDDGLYINIHEAAVENYPTTNLDIDLPSMTLRTWLTPDAEGWKGHLQTPCHSPWRTVMVVDDARKVLASRLILNLNEPCRIADTSWIHPTKYMGVWWEMITGRSSWSYTWDFPAVELGVSDYAAATPHGHHGANNDNVRRYIDFAAENGFDGLLIEGWNIGWEDWFGCQKDYVFDFVTPYPDFDIAALNAYAHKKGIRLIMHHETSSSTANYDRHLEAALQLMNQYGYDAVKTGYVGDIIPFGEKHYSQSIINHYNRVIREAARHHVMVNAHEAVRPTGLCRTWPNMIGNESARGTEFRSLVDPAHLTILPYTRLQGGPMDFTPGIFENDMSRLNPDNRDYVRTTLCKQLATYVTLYSPLQMAADLPEHYAAHMDAFQFIKDVAVDWEQSRYLLAEPGQMLVVARQARKESLDKASRGVAALPDGKKDYVNAATRFARTDVAGRPADKDVWFVGGVTNADEREVSFPLDFLRAGAYYDAIIYRDAPGASGTAGVQPDGSDPAKRYLIEKRQVSAADSLTVWMASSGGFAISLKEL